MAGKGHILYDGGDNDLVLWPHVFEVCVVGLCCLCHVHLQGGFLFLPKLALGRADITIWWDPAGPVLP